MAVRRPLVRAGGKDQQLPAGDTLAGLPLYVRAHTQASTVLRLALDTDYALTAYTRAGAALSVQVVLNG